MGVLDWFISSTPGGAAGQLAGGAIQGLMSGVGTLARDLRTVITGKLDPEKQAEFDSKLAEFEHLGTQGQIEINKIEAASSNWFVAGWRPAVGWICAFALGYQFIGFSLLQWTAQIFKFTSPPALATDGLVTILMTLLGLGTLRTVEKAQDISSKH